MNAVLVGFKRSPFTIANKGLLSKIRPEDILSQVINDLVKTTNINKDDIEDNKPLLAIVKGDLLKPTRTAFIKNPLMSES